MLNLLYQMNKRERELIKDTRLRNQQSISSYGRNCVGGWHINYNFPMYESENTLTLAIWHSFPMARFTSSTAHGAFLELRYLKSWKIEQACCSVGKESSHRKTENHEKEFIQKCQDLMSQPRSAIETKSQIIHLLHPGFSLSLAE